METSLELKERREDIKIAEDKVRDDLSTWNVEINVEKSRKRRLSAETMKSRGKRRSLVDFRNSGKGMLEENQTITLNFNNRISNVTNATDFIGRNQNGIKRMLDEQHE